MAARLLRAGSHSALRQATRPLTSATRSNAAPAAVAQAEAVPVEPLTVPLEELSYVPPEESPEAAAALRKHDLELRQLELESLWQSDVAGAGQITVGDERSQIDEFADHLTNTKKTNAAALESLNSAHYGCYASTPLEKALTKSHWELLTAHVKEIIEANPALRDTLSADMAQHFKYHESVLPRLDVVSLTNDDSGELPLTFSEEGVQEVAEELVRVFRSNSEVAPAKLLRILLRTHTTLAEPAFGVAAGAPLLYIDGVPIVCLQLRWVNSLRKKLTFARDEPALQMVAELLSPTNLVTALLRSQERGSEMQLGFASEGMLDSAQVKEESAVLFHTDGANGRDAPLICFRPYTSEDAAVIMKFAHGKFSGARRENRWLKRSVLVPAGFLDKAPTTFTVVPVPRGKGPLRQHRVVLTGTADVGRVVSLFNVDDDQFVTLNQDGLKAFAGVDYSMQLVAMGTTPVAGLGGMRETLMHLMRHTDTPALPVTFSFMPKEALTSEDDVLVSSTRAYCSMLVGRVLQNAVKGMSSTSNYNKTANQRVNGDSASREVFTARLPPSFSVEKTPHEFAAVKKLFWAEMRGKSTRCLSSCLPSDILRALRAKEPRNPFELFAVHQLQVEEMRKEEIDRLLEETDELGYQQMVNIRQTVARDRSMVLSSLSGNLRIQSSSPEGCLEQLNFLRCDRLSKWLAQHPTPSDITLNELETWFTEVTKELKKASIRRAALRRSVGEHSGKWTREFSNAVLVKEVVEEDMSRAITVLRQQHANNLIDRCHVEWGGPAASNVVHFTVMSAQAIVDRYVPLKKLLKMAASCSARPLMENVLFIDSTKKENARSLGIEGSVAKEQHSRSEYLAGGVSLELFGNISYHGYRPFTCHTLKVTSSNQGGRASSDVRSIVAMRFDSSVLDMAPLMTRSTADFPPMLCQPDSWAQTSKTYTEFWGTHALPTSPYLSMRAQLLRAGNESGWLTTSMLQTCVPALYKTPFVESLDYINSVKWQVSDVAISHLVRVKGRGEDFGDKLRGGYVPLLPPPPAHKTLKSMGAWHDACEEMKGKITDRKQAVESGAQVLDLIRRFRSTEDMKHIHLPCNCDFRGRAYPMHTGLNYQASDFVRSSLVFAEKKPITKSGVKHLKIHAANLMGLDKKSFDERIKWCDDNVEEIVKMRDRPYGDDALWRKADKPLLGYVVLCELADALCHSQGIENFETGVPIHVDGSCNGLQHYSAMSLHPKGAATANLSKKTWAESPSDIYTTVLEVVKAKNLAIIEEPSSPLADLAARTHPFLARKTVKQSVMTNVYGVTNLGMRDQVLSQLHPLNESLKKAYTSQQLGEMAGHITRLIVLSLTDVFQGAMEIQAWFKDMVTTLKDIHKETFLRMPPLTWLSPVCVMSLTNYAHTLFTKQAGVPVGQPYFADSKKLVSVPMYLHNVSFHESTLFGDIDFGKQKSALPPNLVHSLDGSHVHLTTCMLKEKGVTDFGAVHDSYWGHPADMDVLNSTLRESFVKLYTPNRMEDLYLDFSSQYGMALSRAGKSLPPPPPRGDFDISEVLESPYFFA